jgi:hypothetical protein
MSKIKTFIDALKSGETKTTKAIEQVVGVRKAADRQALLDALDQPHALKSPLAKAFKDALIDAGLKRNEIKRCINAWPENDKETARVALVKAMKRGDRVRFRWGLKSGAGYDAESERDGNTTTITALSPHSSLETRGNSVYVGPTNRN